MVIQHNIMAINAHRQLGMNNTALSEKLEKLSSGYRINVAADDASGLAVSEKMRKQITGLSRAVLNAQDGISLVQTAEGALQEVHAQLNRLEQMAVQAANGIYAADDRAKLQAETDALLEEFDRISEATNFNGIQLLDGSLSKNKGITNAAIAQAPPPYATPMALSAMSAFGAPVAGLEGNEEIMGIQPLGGDIMPLALVTIDFDSLKDADATGDGWSYSAANKLLTITGSNTFEINGTRTQTDTRIVVASGVTAGITLNNINIAGIPTGYKSPLELSSGSDVTLVLANGSENTLVGTKQSAGILVNSAKLTIEGKGTLNTQGSEHWPGIGSTEPHTIIINDGVINATGGANASGIGGSNGFKGGTITINGGTITATGSEGGAGIGGGYHGDGGNTTINGGTVTATGGSYGAGIGGGSYAAGGTITISSGIVTATGGNYGTGIGGGYRGAGASLTIRDGVVEATGGSGASAIGSGTTTITGGNLTMTDPANNINGDVLDGSNTKIYCVEVQGIAFGAYEEINYTFNGVNYTKTTDSNGRVYLYLPQSAHHGAFTMTYKSTTYDLKALVKTNHAGFIRFDETPPVAAPGGAYRYSETDGSVWFTSNEAGEYYYAVVEKGASAPTINTSGAGIACNDTEQTITLTGLTGEGAKDVYVVMKDEVGNLSSVVKIELESSDHDAPTISSASSERIDTTTGTVEFDSSEAGTCYYLVKDADEAPPVSVEDIKGGASDTCNIGSNVINLTGLTGNSAKTVYLVVEDAAGNVSGIQQIGLEAFVPKYDVEIKLPDDVTLPPNTDISVTIDGEEKTVQTDSDGKLVVELPDGKHDIEISHDSKDYEGSITVDGAGASVELVEYVPPPPPPPPPPAKGLVLQIGDTSDDYNKLTVYIEGTSAVHLGLSGLSLQTQEAASAALSKIRDAIERVSVNRGQLGAYQNRLEYTINNLNVTVENMTAAESRIRDADMASEMMGFTKYNVLAQAAQAMLAQANMQPQQVMQLLR